MLTEHALALARPQVMSRFAKPLLSEEAVSITCTAFKAAAVVAETGVFIYLGQAVFTFPILHHTVWRLVLLALVACGLGRMHVVLGVQFFNWYRARRIRRVARTKAAGADASPAGCDGKADLAPPPMAILRSLRRAGRPEPFTRGVSLVLWWSGLRGGVAFALATSSYGYGDFRQHCGGARGKAHAFCPEGHSMTDSLAILQCTLIVATTSIFLLGGSIKNVAQWCGVLERDRDVVNSSSSMILTSREPRQ